MFSPIPSTCYFYSFLLGGLIKKGETYRSTNAELEPWSPNVLEFLIF